MVWVEVFVPLLGVGFEFCPITQEHILLQIRQQKASRIVQVSVYSQIQGWVNTDTYRRGLSWPLSKWKFLFVHGFSARYHQIYFMLIILRWSIHQVRFQCLWGMITVWYLYIRYTQIGILKYRFLHPCKTIIYLHIKRSHACFHFTYKHMTGQTSVQLSNPSMWFLRTSLRHATEKAECPLIFQEPLTVNQMKYGLFQHLTLT